MERGLEKTIDEVMMSPGVKGVMFTDRHGLCLGVKGQGSKFCAGGVTSIAKVAAKLDPGNRSPQLVLLEGPNKQCLIQQRGDLTGAIYKVTSTPATPNV